MSDEVKIESDKVKIERTDKGFNVTYEDKTIFHQFFNDITPVVLGQVFNIQPKLIYEAKLRTLYKFKGEDIESIISERYLEEKRFIPKWLADEIMSIETFITLIDTKEIYVFQDGYYQRHGEQLIESLCEKNLGKEYRKHRASEVVEYIRASTYTERENAPVNLIALKNGVYDLETDELRLHDRKHQFFSIIPVDYDPEAECPKIKKFLTEITASQEDVQILEEVIGYCLFRDYRFHKVLILVGSGANGKSTFLTLLKTLLGFKNVSGRSLQELEENKFAKADLFGRLANICADLPDRPLYRTSIFKILTGQDIITAEKKFRESFNFVNYAKLLFSTNKIPEAYDDSSAFFRRWIIMVFPNVFTGDKCNPKILEELMTPEELSGLLNLALQGLKRLLENSMFSYSQTIDQIREEYKRKSSPVASFVMDIIIVDSENWIEKKELYLIFSEYCRDKKIPVVSQDTFFKSLPRYASVRDFRARLGDRRYRAIKGIRIKEEKEEGTLETTDRSKITDFIQREKPNIASIEALEEPEKGKCLICQNERILYYGVKGFKGEWGLVCEDCGSAIMKELKEA